MDAVEDCFNTVLALDTLHNLRPEFTWRRTVYEVVRDMYHPNLKRKLQLRWAPVSELS